MLLVYAYTQFVPGYWGGAQFEACGMWAYQARGATLLPRSKFLFFIKAAPTGNRERVRSRGTSRVGVSVTGSVFKIGYHWADA